MVSFDLTDEQRLLEQSVREWAAREVAPHIHDADRAHRFDRDRILVGMAELGLLGISVPEQHGGAGSTCYSGRPREPGPICSGWM